MYPYHMPGHKRQAWGALPQQLYELDITEIEGFDNLHQAEGILQELQKKAARISSMDACSRQPPFFILYYLTILPALPAGVTVPVHLLRLSIYIYP